MTFLKSVAVWLLDEQNRKINRPVATKIADILTFNVLKTFPKFIPFHR